MTDVAVPIHPPSQLADRSTADVDADAFRAATADALTAVQASGGGLYLAVPADTPPAAESFVTELRTHVLDDAGTAPVLDVPGEDGAPGLRATYRVLRETSDAASVGILDPTVALLGRRHLDTAAMRLRREDVIVGPTPAGCWYFLGASLSTDANLPPLDVGIDELAVRLASDDRHLGIMPMRPVLTRAADVPGIRRLVNAHREGEERISPHLTAALTS